MELAAERHHGYGHGEIEPVRRMLFIEFREFVKKKKSYTTCLEAYSLPSLSFYLSVKVKKILSRHFKNDFGLVKPFLWGLILDLPKFTSVCQSQ